jgi:hypothetical protein
MKNKANRNKNEAKMIMPVNSPGEGEPSVSRHRRTETGRSS